MVLDAGRKLDAAGNVHAPGVKRRHNFADAPGMKAAGHKDPPLPDQPGEQAVIVSLPGAAGVSLDPGIDQQVEAGIGFGTGEGSGVFQPQRLEDRKAQGRGQIRRLFPVELDAVQADDPGLMLDQGGIGVNIDAHGLKRARSFNPKMMN